MAKRAKAKASTPVEALKHKDRRKNIPTEELRDFVAEDERTPKTILYPRDSSLDPQLVWKGKDEQDQRDLEVPALPVYIQEKIHPKALIENLRKTAAQGEPEPELTLFDDFNGLPFEDLIDFYEHEQNWTNRLILGDSLMVMTSLAEKEGLKGQVQMIYVDPPYGIEFKSNWQVSTRKREVTDGKAEHTTRQPEQIQAFRDTWKKEIHSYLAYLRDRLIVARGLLTESGSIFVQIGDQNVHLVRSLLDETFGRENFVASIFFRKKTMPLGAAFLEQMGDYIVWYARERPRAKYKELFKLQQVAADFHWDWFELEDGTRQRIARSKRGESVTVPEGARNFRLVSMWPPTFSEKSVFPVEYDGDSWLPPPGQCWPTNSEGMKRLVGARRIESEGRFLRYVYFLDDDPWSKITTTWNDTSGARDQKYVVETTPKAIERCILMTTDPGDLVLDPTCGSGTTAYVAEQWARRWITIDTSRVALALARTRLVTARFPYYLLSDSTEGIQKEMEVSGRVAPAPVVNNDIKKGFVYKRVPRITLKAIANNPDIQEGMSREEIETAIARHAEFELLYDQPYEDSKRIRVTGPFTVESLSPHRMLGEDRDRSIAEQVAQEQLASVQFEAMILDNLKKAGVQNTFKGERLVFDRLEPFAGQWIHAEGEYTDKEGAVRRVGVSIGPEHGTVGSDQVKEAAKEAVQGVGFDVLIICGFAFDPHVSEEAKRYGKLTVLPTRMNPDLSMGDELLKKTGAGNLFMVFGEPDVEIKAQNGQMTVEIRGLDVYDPTTGEIRSSSTDDIACWFIDTNYDGESFFVRHAYFTGADEPYEKLKRALLAEIDEAAWASLYSAKSRPFDVPTSGKIAVKVINHYGDEVLRVYEAKDFLES